jgi:hypothetical protein
MSARSGQAAISMALSLTFLFSVLGFSVDLGYSYFQKQAAQAAADSAVLAASVYAKTNGTTCGANGIVCNSTPTVCTGITTGVFYVGCQYANSNGFPLTAISMSGNTGSPPSAPGTSPTYWVKATVSTTNKNLFLRFAGFANAAINAEATAGVVSSGGGGGTNNCLVVLDPTGAQALFLTGQITLTLGSCSVQVNSTADDITNHQPNGMAANANGQNTINGTVNVAGGSASGSQTYCANPPFHCHTAAVADPLLGLPAFDPATVLGHTTCDQSSTYTISQGTVTIPSGIYCGGIHISGGNVTFQTGGSFMLKNGGLTIDNGTAAGANVMFFLTSSNPTTTTDPLVLLSTSAITLSAPSSGTFKGILFYGDRTAPADSVGNFNSIQAQASPTLSGTMYFPKGNLKLTGQAGLSGYIAVIARRVDIEAQSTFNWDGTGTYTGLAAATPSAYLIE